LDKPELGKDVIVPFTAQDADPDRKEYDRTTALKKLISDTLENTNWRLMAEGVSHRLGYVSGRLKGYEREEEFAEAFGKKKETLSKINHGLRAKWAHDPLVSIARMMGKSEATENLRKKRLEKEPEGFHLQESEGAHTCRICQNNVSGKDTWWDLNGVKCLDCQRNIKEGVVPAEVCQDKDIFIKDWQLRTDYSLHPATAKKLRREGLLHGRDLKTKQGATYHTVYLKSENKKFFKKYPRKETMKVEFTNSEEKEIVKETR
jgi:hypothetical protein